MLSVVFVCFVFGLVFWRIRSDSIVTAALALLRNAYLLIWFLSK